MQDSPTPRKPIVAVYGSNTSFQEAEARGQKLTMVWLPSMEKEIVTRGVCALKMPVSWKPVTFPVS